MMEVYERISKTGGGITGTKIKSPRKPLAKNSSNGSWGHVRRALANEQLYRERVKLLHEWFDVWDPSQRCKFFISLLKRCNPYEIEYIQGWFIQRAPILRQDFTSALPNWMSLYIFSFLDPKSLCRAAQVSWHWRFLTEQDVLWIPKCVKRGWFLPYVPGEKEFGAWKFHYINCVDTLGFEPLAYHVYNPADTINIIEVSNNLGEGEVVQQRLTRKSLEESAKKSAVQENYHDPAVRPPWKYASKSPRIFEKEKSALLDSRPKSSNFLLTTTKPHKRSKSVPWSTLYFARRWQNRSKSPLRDLSIYEQQISKTSRQSSPSLVDRLSVSGRQSPEVSRLFKKSSDFESSLSKKLIPKRKGSLFHTMSQYEIRSFHNLKSKDLLSLSLNYPTHGNPRVLFISSSIPAKEVLLECILYGVIGIPYDFDGTTLDALLDKLALVLAGREAKSIGFVLDGNKSKGSMNIVKGWTVMRESLETKGMQEFWKQLTLHISSAEEGSVDVFWPVAATEDGLALIEDLSKLTGIQFSSPIGFTGSCTRMETEWFKENEECSPPLHYFSEAKLFNWIKYCEFLEETTALVKDTLSWHIRNEYRDITDRSIGNIVYKLMKLTDLEEIEKLCTVISQIAENVWENSEETNKEIIAKITNLIGLEFDLEMKKHSTLEGRKYSPKAETRIRCVQEIMEKELSNKEKLTVLLEVYKKPLLAAVESNRPIISSASIQIIFSDVETLQSLSRELVLDLDKRIENWTAEQCIGDVYLKLTTNLKAYSNFLKNYSTILSTVERCQEENPVFRAFLDGQRKDRRSQGLIIPELLLIPAQITQERSEHMSSLLKCTPGDHKDRKFIMAALQKLTEIAKSFQQTKERMKNEERFKKLGARISGCPCLLENGRLFVKEMALAELADPRKGHITYSNGSSYLKVRYLSLFLFNDVLLITRRYMSYRPFHRTVNCTLKFGTVISLGKLQISDVQDTKYFENAFQLTTTNQKWLLQAKSHDEKVSSMSILKQTIATALPLTTELLNSR